MNDEIYVLMDDNIFEVLEIQIDTFPESSYEVTYIDYEHKMHTVFLDDKSYERIITGDAIRKYKFDFI